jgi:uncharacterized protein YndB with AHSA1/START domain
MPYPKTVNRTIAINAPVSVVWQALTDPEQVKEWYSPDKASTVTAEWRVGGPILFEGTWDRRKYLNRGTILAFDPEKTLRYDIWSKLSRLPDTLENYTVVEFALTPTANGTSLTLTHTNFQSEAIYGHANFYWVTALDRLRKFLERPNL